MQRGDHVFALPNHLLSLIKAAAKSGDVASNLISCITSGGQLKTQVRTPPSRPVRWQSDQDYEKNRLVTGYGIVNDRICVA